MCFAKLDATPTMKQLFLIPLIFCAGCASSPESKTSCAENTSILEVLDVVFADSMKLDLKQLKASLKQGYSYGDAPYFGVVYEANSGQGFFFSFFDLSNPLSFVPMDDNSLVTGICLYDSSKNDLMSGKFIYPVSVRGKTFADYDRKIIEAEKDPEKVKAYKESMKAYLESI
jgi:hypothetical protein